MPAAAIRVPDCVLPHCHPGVAVDDSTTHLLHQPMISVLPEVARRIPDRRAPRPRYAPWRSKLPAASADPLPGCPARRSRRSWSARRRPGRGRHRSARSPRRRRMARPFAGGAAQRHVMPGPPCTRNRRCGWSAPRSGRSDRGRTGRGQPECAGNRPMSWVGVPVQEEGLGIGVEDDEPRQIERQDRL